MSQLRDMIHAERRANNARVHNARLLVWESEQPTEPICGWDALIDSIWEDLYRDFKEKVQPYCT